MKRFINSKISKNKSFDLVINYGVISVSFITLFLVFSSVFLNSALLSVFLTFIIVISLLSYSRKYYYQNRVANFTERLLLCLLYIALIEILCEYFGRNLFSLFFILMPLIYAYGGRTSGILTLLIVSAIEINLARELSIFYKLIPLAIATLVFGSFIRGERYMEGRIKKKISSLLQNSITINSVPESVNTEDRIQSLIKNDLKNLGEFLPYNSIVLYLKNGEGLYEICEFISKDRELIDSTQKLNFRTGYIGWTVKTGTPFMIGNIKNPSENITYYNREINIQSLLIIPLTDNSLATSEDEKDITPKGILIVDSKEPGTFDNKHKLLATIVADRINSLLTIFSLQNTISESSEKLNSIYKYIQQLETNMETGNILENLFVTLHSSIQSDMLCISLKRGSESEIVLTGKSENSIEGMTFSHAQSLIGIVSENNTTLNLSDISDRSRFRDVFSKEIDLGLGMKSIRSSMLFPVSTSDDDDADIFGAVFFGNIRKEEFNEEQKNLAKMLIQQAAKSIKYSLNLKNVKELAIKDGLSGLYNQSHFKEMLSNSIAKAHRFNDELSLILLDIDNFKEINDKYGHLAGDRIISEIGKTIRNSLREVDLSARYGGDEFAILLEKTDPPGAKIAAEKIASVFENRPVIFNNEKIKVNLSIGIATYPENASSQEILIEKADISLYEAKKCGKNLIVHFNEIGTINNNIEEKIKLDKNISRND